MGRSTVVATPPPGTHSQGSFTEPKALPGFDLINQAVNGLKARINDGQGCSFSKVGAYLGYRLITYSCVPLVLNLISTLVAGILCLLTLPTRCCNKKANDWCWNRFTGSVQYVLRNLIIDMTCDFRQITGRPCCNPSSNYIRI